MNKIEKFRKVYTNYHENSECENSDQVLIESANEKITRDEYNSLMSIIDSHLLNTITYTIKRVAEKNKDIKNSTLPIIADFVYQMAEENFHFIGYQHLEVALNEFHAVGEMFEKKHRKESNEYWFLFGRYEKTFDSFIEKYKNILQENKN